jgi:hypothetical protein
MGKCYLAGGSGHEAHPGAAALAPDRGARAVASLSALALLALCILVPAEPAWAKDVPEPPGGGNSGVQVVDKDIDGGAMLTQVSCPTIDWCVAGAENGTVVTWSSGTWGAPTMVFKGPDGSIDGLSCPTVYFCMAVSDIGGYSIFSGGTWSAPKKHTGWGVSCPTTSFCLEERSGFGNISAWDAGTWSLAYNTEFRNGSSNESARPVSCLAGSTPTCMYVDQYDHYTVDNGHWSHPMARIPGSSKNAGAVSCSAEPLGGLSQVSGPVLSVGRTPTCTVVDYAGYAFTWHGSSWTQSGEIDSAATNPHLNAVSCVYQRCAAVDQDGNVLYQDLVGTDVATWTKPFAMGAGGEPADISCASLSFCMVVTSGGNAALLNPSV